jgi:hypothetical protein
MACHWDKPGMLSRLLVTSKSQGARAHSDYFLCPPGNGAIATTLPSQAGPPAVAPARGDATDGPGASLAAGAVFPGRR